MSETDAEVLLRAGSTFGRYDIVRRIGRGGMGAVYQGLHAELKKRVAIKALLPPMSENPDLRARFLREGQAASRIRHPHVVDIYDVGELGGVPYLVMEYLEGEDLGALLTREGKLEVERTADILVPVLAAISAAHEEGVIHRDLKPANIFLARDRYNEILPKVLDFGISKLTNDAIQEGLTGTGAIFGTPFYMSPEQALGGKTVDVKSDQYSLGVIFYQCLTGKRPFEADSMYSILHSIVQGVFSLPRMVVPNIPEAVEDIILRAMAKNPALRFESVRDLGAAVLPQSSPRTRSQWTHAFLVVPSELTPAPTEIRPQAMIPTKVLPYPSQEPGMPLAEETSPFAATMSPDPVRTLPPPAIEAAPDSRLTLAFAAMMGLLLSVVVGSVIWWATRPVEAIVVDVKPAPPPPPAIVVEQPVIVEEKVEPQPSSPEPVEKKKKKKKVLTGSNNAPILE